MILISTDNIENKSYHQFQRKRLWETWKQPPWPLPSFPKIKNKNTRHTLACYIINGFMTWATAFSGSSLWHGYRTYHRPKQTAMHMHIYNIWVWYLLWSIQYWAACKAKHLSLSHFHSQILLSLNSLTASFCSGSHIYICMQFDRTDPMPIQFPFAANYRFVIHNFCFRARLPSPSPLCSCWSHGFTGCHLLHYASNRYPN